MDRSDAANAARQVLMNELGLTRDSVREMVSQIVVSTVEKKFAAMDLNAEIHKIIEKKLDEVANSGYWTRQTIAKLVNESAEKQVKAFIAERLQIDFHLREAPRG